MLSPRKLQIDIINAAKFENALEVEIDTHGGTTRLRLNFAEHIQKPVFWVNLFNVKTRRYVSPCKMPHFKTKQLALEWFADNVGRIRQTTHNISFLSTKGLKMPRQHRLI